MLIHNNLIQGAVDEQTRCQHYDSEKDIIAIKFYCCDQYFPCYRCHKQHGCGKHSVWPVESFQEQAIICGACGIKMTINEYLVNQDECPSCQSPFNPGCSLHTHLYFEMNN